VKAIRSVRGWKLYSFHDAETEDTPKLTGRAIERGYVNKENRDHDTDNPRRIFISGQKAFDLWRVDGGAYRPDYLIPVLGALAVFLKA
jgi:hypothetical protein